MSKIIMIDKYYPRVEKERNNDVWSEVKMGESKQSSKVGGDKYNIRGGETISGSIINK